MKQIRYLGIAVAIVFCVLNFVQAQPMSVTGYYPTWWYGSVDASAIDFHSLTNMILFSAQDASASSPYFQNNCDDGSHLQTLVAAAHAAGTKVLISVTGGYGQTNMPVVAADAAKCSTFVATACAWAKARNLDGIELDWEFPRTADATGWARLTRLFRQTLDTWSPKGLLFTSADYTPPQPSFAYNVDSMKVFDKILLMNYTMWMGATQVSPYKSGFDSPVNLPTQFSGYTGTSLSQSGLASWISAGYPISKLAVGLSFESSVFSGVTTMGQSYSSYTFGSSANSPYGSGYAAVPASGRAWDATAQAAYCINGGKVYSYEDTNSVKAIVAWARAQGCTNIMVYDFPVGQDASITPHDNLLRVLAREAFAGSSSPVPTIVAGSISAFGNVVINTTATNSYSISASNLTPSSGNITITPPNGYQVSISSSSGFTSSLNVAYTGGVLASTTIYVQFSPIVVQSYGENIVNTGGGTTTNVAVNGNGVSQQTTSYLAVSSNKRYIQANGVPYFLNIDAAWSMIAQLTYSQANTYLTDRANRKFSGVLVNLIEHQFSNNAPKNIYNVSPWNGATFSTQNEQYFLLADSMINRASQLGLTVVLAPVYVGYACGSEGWCAEIQAATFAAMRTWGIYVGNRYKNYPNIIWVIGADANPTSYSGLQAKLDTFTVALRQADNVYSRIMTAHNEPESQAITDWGGSGGRSWLNLNGFYTYSTTLSTNADAAYTVSPTMPFILEESAYENEHSSTAQTLRAQAYWTILRGGCGSIFGNNPIWDFASGWQSALSSAGSTSMTHFDSLFTSRHWYSLVPDKSASVITSGASSGTALATFAYASDSSTIIGYLPTSRAVTINPAKLKSNNTKWSWVNPGTGTWTTIGTYDKSSRSVTPSSGDWVLVIDTTTATSVITPILSISASSHAFGNVTINSTSSEWTYTISGVNLSPASGNITITAPTGYEVSRTTGSGFSSSVIYAYTSGTLPSTTIYIHFKPTAVQSYTGNITNTGGGSTTQNVAVTGAGVSAPTPTLTVNPTSLSFGNVVINTISSKLSYTLTGSNLSPAIDTLTITAPSGFTISTDSSSGFTLSKRIPYTSGTLSAKTIYVRFSPTAVQSYTGNITNTGGGSTTKNVAVTGSGISNALPIITINPVSLAFSTVRINTTSGEQTYTVQGSNLSPSSGNITITPPSGYQVSVTSDSGFCSSLNISYTDSTLSSRTIYVRFSPTAIQSYTGNIMNAGGGATTQNVAVTGTGVSATTPALTVNPKSLSFGNVIINTTSEHAYTLTGLHLSPAIDTLTITAPSGFTISTVSGSGFASSIKVGYTNGMLRPVPKIIYVRFSPTSVQSYSDSIINIGGGAAAKNVIVSGNGVLDLPLPIGTFTASSDTLPEHGGPVTLTWTSSNATSASINNGIGMVATNGSLTRTIRATTRFILTLSNLNGHTSYIKKVYVKPRKLSQNKALYMPSAASSVELTGVEAPKANDGNESTRWSSICIDNQWWQVDLQDISTIDNVTVTWDSSYAAQFTISTSLDGLIFTDAATGYASGPDTIELNFDPVDTRYVRLTGIQRGTQFGISFFELGVYKSLTTSVESTSEVPCSFSLEQNFPNPFNPSTEIGYQLSTTAEVQLVVYNVIGKEIATLVNQTQRAGHHNVIFNANNLASGMYYAKLQAEGKSQIRKMVLIK